MRDKYLAGPFCGFKKHSRVKLTAAIQPKPVERSAMNWDRQRNPALKHNLSKRVPGHKRVAELRRKVRMQFLRCDQSQSSAYQQ
jgi:hypothetical protein